LGSRERFWRHIVLLWLAGNALRFTILAVPPVVPAIHRDLQLNEKLVGVVTGLPVLLLGVGALFGSLLVARIGARRALVTGLVVVAIAGALRGAGPTAAVLFLMTFVMGIGIAVSQPTLPSLVRAWFPGNPGMATAVFSNGFLVGEVLAAALTVPLILPLVGGHWEPGLAAWSIPVAATAIAIAMLTSHEPRDPAAAPVRWWPEWGSLTWRLGLILGCAATAYFGSNAFIPDYLKATHHAQDINAALTSLNLVQLPASIVAATIPRRVIARRWPIVGAGILTAVSAAGFAMGGGWVVIWAGLMGFSTATVFVLALALPPLLTGADDVHRLTAAMFTITYSCPFVASLVGGATWDATGIPVSTFAPVAAAGVAMIALVYRLDLAHARPIGT
jgi:CP family cyanate transporter-like MFS transporter